MLFCDVLIITLFAHFVGRQINPELLSWGHRLTQNRPPYLWQQQWKAKQFQKLAKLRSGGRWVNTQQFGIQVFPPITNIARIANAVPVTLYSRVSVNVEIVVLNC